MTPLLPCKSEAVDTTSVKPNSENVTSEKNWFSHSTVDPSKTVDKECDGSSVKDFLSGKCNKLHGFDVRPIEKRTKNPTWGVDEFRKIHEYTPAGIPYQKINPFFKIESPSIYGGEGSPFKFQQPMQAPSRPGFPER